MQKMLNIESEHLNSSHIFYKAGQILTQILST